MSTTTAHQRLTTYQDLPLDPLPSDVLEATQGAIDAGCHVWFKPYLGHEGRAQINALFISASAKVATHLGAAGFKQMTGRRSDVWRWSRDTEAREVHINRPHSTELTADL